MADLRDIELRNAALEHVREVQRRYDDLVPVRALGEGFQFRGRRASFGSFYSGIFRPKELAGPAALCLVTAPPKHRPAGVIRRRIRRSHGIAPPIASAPPRHRRRRRASKLPLTIARSSQLRSSPYP
ncbi:MAG TPA: hypothetical protein VF526_22200 [Solirubrobacteraceae bacterium]